MWKILAAIPLLVLVGCGGTTPTSRVVDSPAAQSPAQQGQSPALPAQERTTAAPSKVPESSIGGTLDLTVGDAKISVTLKSAQLHGQGAFELVEAGEQLVDAEMAIECKSGAYSANPMNFTFVLKDGQREIAAPAWFDGAMQPLEMQAGQNLAGKVWFMIPDGKASGGKIALVHDARDVGYWVFG